MMQDMTISLTSLTHVPPHPITGPSSLGTLSVVSASDSRRVLPSTNPQLARRQRVCVRTSRVAISSQKQAKMTGTRRTRRATTSTAAAAAAAGVALWLAAMAVKVVEAADPVYMPLTYKPRTSASPAPGGQWSTMSVGADGKQKVSVCVCVCAIGESDCNGRAWVW